MTDLIIPDLSEFQGTVDWPALVRAGYPVAIVRVHNGTRPDHYWAQNRTAAHAAGVRGLGLYQYLVAGRDAAVQAGEFCDLVGALRPGEWPILDLEEGSGDQSGRARAWYQVVAARLGNAAGEELYSGDYFFGAHRLGAAGFGRVWLAAYSSREPSTAHELWQFTDARSFPGVAGSNDASVFHGSVDELLARVSPPTPAPSPSPSPAVRPVHLLESTMVILTVDKATVPKGSAWPGVFLLDAGVLVHVETPADEQALKAAGVPAMGVAWADYERILAKQ